MNIVLEIKKFILAGRKSNRNTDNGDIFYPPIQFVQNHPSHSFSILPLPLPANPNPFPLISLSRMENVQVFLQSFSKMKEIKSGNFANKLHSLLANPSHEDIIAWTDNKTAFEVIDQLRMESDILPLYFRQTKFESFVRQLNLYGFKKVKTQQTVKFTHPLLQQGNDLSSISTVKVSKGKAEAVEKRGEPEPLTRLVIPVEGSNNDDVGQDRGNSETLGQNRSNNDQIKNIPIRPQEICSSPFCFPQVVYFAINPYMFWNFPSLTPSSDDHELSLQAGALI